MAQQQSTPSSSVLAKKNALLANRFDRTLGWSTIRHKGYRRVVMPNLCGTRVYLLDPQGRTCNCKDGVNGLLCSHRLALLEALNQDAIGAWLEEHDEPPLPTRKGYAALYPECRTAGCTEVSERHGGMCDDCSSKEVSRLDRERRSSLVAAGGRR